MSDDMVAPMGPAVAPGMYPDMGESEYFALHAFSNSAASRLLMSEAHYHHYRLHGIEQTPAMLLGKLVHTLVLEPELANVRYAIKPDCDRRTKDGKAAYEAFLAEKGSRDEVSANDVGQARSIAAAVAAHPAASIILKGLETEVSILWQQHGIPCKARIDLPRTALLADLKTTNDASKSAFARSCATLGYHRQAAHYLDGYEAVTGDKPAGMLFVVVEKEPPYAVGVYELDDIELGRAQIARAAKRWHEYWDAPDDDRRIVNGYSPLVERIALPQWIHYQEQEQSA